MYTYCMGAIMMRHHKIPTFSKSQYLVDVQDKLGRKMKWSRLAIFLPYLQPTVEGEHHYCK